MRKVLTVGAMALTTAMIMPLQAQAATITHSAPVPCAVACAYWDAPTTAGFNECDAPFPPGSYDYTILRLTSVTGVAHFEAKSAIDYDSFLCTNTSPSILIQSMANIVGEDCEGIAGRNAVAVGCTEVGDLTYNGLVQATGDDDDMTFKLISYNWSDNDVLPITYSGPVAIVNDSYTAGTL